MGKEINLKEVIRHHYFVRENAIYSVQVIKRDGGLISSYCQIAGTKKLIKTLPSRNLAMQCLQSLLKRTGVQLT